MSLYVIVFYGVSTAGIDFFFDRSAVETEVYDAAFDMLEPSSIDGLFLIRAPPLSHSIFWCETTAPLSIVLMYSTDQMFIKMLLSFFILNWFYLVEEDADFVAEARVRDAQGVGRVMGYAYEGGIV